MKRYTKNFFYIGILWALIISLGRAAPMEVTMQVDSTQIGMEDEIQLTVAISGNDDVDIEDMEVKGMEEFKAYGGSSSSSVSIINGRTQIQKEFGFTLIPKKNGTFTIGPVKVHGKEYGETISITVGGNTRNTNDADMEEGKKDEPFFVQAQIDNKSPYMWQQVHLVFSFWTRTQIFEGSMGDVKFDGFIHEKLPQNQSQRETHQTIDGVTWKVTQVFFPLFPTQSGKLTIPPIQLQIKAAVTSKSNANRRPTSRRSLLDSFFGDDPFSRITQTKIFKLETKPIEINVKPMPEKVPEDFGNGVGEFTSQIHIGKNKLQVGESTTITLTIKGNGHMPGIKSPKLELNEFFKNNFKIYEDKANFTPSYENFKFGGSKVFKWALVPIQEFTGKFPEIPFVYFDTKTNSYKKIENNLGDIQILPGNPGQQEQLIVSPNDAPAINRNIKELGNDLIPFITQYSPSIISLDNQKLGIILVVVNICGLVFFLFFRIHSQRESLIRLDPKKMKKSIAYKNFKSELEEKNAHKGQEKIEIMALNLSKILRQYLGDKLGFDGLAWTPIEVENQIQTTKLPPEVQKTIIFLLKECDKVQYANGTQINGEVKDYKQLEKLVKTCEQYLD